MDGRKARLRDVMDRLRGLGIDGSRYIVVTQGMADALLSASPTERRSLLEQAAGLSGYRVRRDEARQKLATTEQNIATMALVLDEMEPRLRALRRQARAVQDRDEAQALLRRRLHDWYASRWKATRSEAEVCKTQSASIAEDRRASEARLAELENAAEAVFQREREWQQRVDMLVAANHTLERDRDAAQGGRSETEQKLVSIRLQLHAADARALRLVAAEKEAEQHIVRIAQSLEIPASDMVRLQSEEAALGVRLEHERQSLVEAGLERRRIDGEAMAQEEASRAATRRGDELLVGLEQGARRRQEAEHWLGTARVTLQEGERETNALASRLLELDSQSHALTVRLQALEDVAAAARTRGTRLDILGARARGAATDAQRRGDAAERSLHGLTDRGNGSLLHDITVQQGWETAIAAALGSWAHTRGARGGDSTLHEDDNSGFDRWRATLDHAIGSGRWADGLVQGMPPGRVNPLRTAVLVETEAEAHHAWNRLSALPAHTVKTPGITIVTKAGICWNAVGRDASRGDDRAASYLRVKRESAVMKSRCIVLSARAARLDTARTDAIAQSKQIEGEREHVQAERRDIGIQMAELETRLARLQRQRSDLDERSEALLTELRQLDDAESSLQADYLQWEASKREIESAASELKRRLESETARVESMRSRVSALDQKQRDARHAYEVAATTLQAQTQLETAIQAERNRLQSELVAGTREKAELEGTSRRLEAELVAHEQQVKRLNRLLEEHSATLSAARAARPPREVSGEHLREARGAMSTLVRRYERAQSESDVAQQRINALASEIIDEMQVRPEELDASDQEPPSEVEVKRLRSRGLQYADADPSAIEEARELAERHAYLLKHIQDLRAAAETLRVMMEVADTEMRAQFDVAFVAVSEEFSRVFEVMLRGGRAQLEQLDGGGIEISAQLPGKRSRSSAAFSGGERSLIASSLLFGVLKMRPAPFCVLDEVDAALDEGNVDRYLAALRDISRETQAVVVTHNRATMAAADVLYGLTMDDEGASRVLSLRLDAQAAG